tara:strand:- start:692 stop:883 length:192 start_codon:yes stop_codon:yes gene_type:complete
MSMSYKEHMAKMAQTLAYEGREALDTLADTDYYLWFIEAWGTHEDMERAEMLADDSLIQEEEE